MKKALFIILLSVTIDAIGIGIIFPILPDLLFEITQLSDISLLYGFILAGHAFMLFLFAPFLGALSDRLGRKPVLMLAMGGAAIDYLIMSFTPNLVILVIARLIAGMTAASMAVASAYITDISSEEERAKYFGLLYACFGVGFIIGPALGGILGEIWIRAPFLAAAILNGLNFVLALFLLTESHPQLLMAKGRKKRKTAPIAKFNIKKLNPFAPIIWALKLGFLRDLLIIFIGFSFVGTIYSTIWVLFTKDQFAWSSLMIGISLTAYGLFQAGAQAILAGPATNWLGEKKAIIYSLIFEMIALFIIAFTTKWWVIFLLLPIFSLGEVGGPALQSLLTAKIDENDQGRLQGVLMSLASLAAVLGPIFFTFIYSILREYWPGAIWLIALFLYILMLPIIIFGGTVWQRSKNKQK